MKNHVTGPAQAFIMTIKINPKKRAIPQEPMTTYLAVHISAIPLVR